MFIMKLFKKSILWLVALVLYVFGSVHAFQHDMGVFAFSCPPVALFWVLECPLHNHLIDWNQRLDDDTKKINDIITAETNPFLKGKNKSFVYKINKYPEDKLNILKANADIIISYQLSVINQIIAHSANKILVFPLIDPLVFEKETKLRDSMDIIGLGEYAAGIENAILENYLKEQEISLKQIGSKLIDEDVKQMLARKKTIESNELKSNRSIIFNERKKTLFNI